MWQSAEMIVEFIFMEAIYVQGAPDVQRFIGAEELWLTLDGMARRLFGMTALEFGSDYKAGKFAGVAVAGDLAALLGYAKRPR
jgi:hypothetical protein